MRVHDQSNFTTCETGIARRDLLRLAVAGTSAVFLSPFATMQAAAASTTPNVLRQDLRRSEFVYISPLQSTGRESNCHGELWYGWFDDAVVIITSTQTWKARALQRGLDRARIWVGNHGRWKTWYGGRNEQFRSAPSFEARAEHAQDPELFDRLMTLYAKKYADEFGSWGPKQREGFTDGSRILIRYRAI